MPQPESPQPHPSDSSASEQAQRELIAAKAFERHSRSVTNVRQRIITGAPQLASSPCITQSFSYFDSRSSRSHHREAVNTLGVLPGEFDHPHARYTMERMLKGRMIPADPTVESSKEHFVPDALDALVATIGERGWGQHSNLPQEQTARIILISPTNLERHQFDAKSPAYQKWAERQMNLSNKPVVEVSFVLGANGACIDYQTIYDRDATDGISHSSVVLSDGAMLNPHGIDPDFFEVRHANWRWFAEHFADHAR